MAQAKRIVSDRLRALVASTAARVAGFSSAGGMPALNEAVRSALVDLSEVEDTATASPSGEAISLDAMSASEVETYRQHLLAERDELLAAVERGEMIDLRQAAAEWGQKCSVVKSILLSLPGDPALDFTGDDEAAARVKLDAAIDRALAVLDDD